MAMEDNKQAFLHSTPHMATWKTLLMLSSCSIRRKGFDVVLELRGLFAVCTCLVVVSIVFQSWGRSDLYLQLCFSELPSATSSALRPGLNDT